MALECFSVCKGLRCTLVPKAGAWQQREASIFSKSGFLYLSSHGHLLLTCSLRGCECESTESQSSRRSVSSNREWTWIQMGLRQNRKKWVLGGKKRSQWESREGVMGSSLTRKFRRLGEAS